MIYRFDVCFTIYFSLNIENWFLTECLGSLSFLLKYCESKLNAEEDKERFNTINLFIPLVTLKDAVLQNGIIIHDSIFG